MFAYLSSVFNKNPEYKTNLFISYLQNIHEDTSEPILPYSPSQMYCSYMYTYICAQKGYYKLLHWFNNNWNRFIPVQNLTFTSNGELLYNTAAEKGHLDFIIYLSEQSFDTGNMVLAHASKGGQLHVLKYLLDSKTFIIDHRGIEIEYASRYNQYEVIKYIITRPNTVWSLHKVLSCMTNWTDKKALITDKWFRRFLMEQNLYYYPRLQYIRNIIEKDWIYTE